MKGLSSLRLSCIFVTLLTLSESYDPAHSENGQSPNRTLIRLVRRTQREFPGLPTTAARSLTGASSPWRISYNSIAAKARNNTSNGWTGIKKRLKPELSPTSTTPVPNTTLNVRHYQLKNHSDAFKPMRLAFPKKNLIPRFGVGTLKRRKPELTSTTTSTTTEAPTTTEALTTTRPKVMEPQPRRYVEIDRRAGPGQRSEAKVQIPEDEETDVQISEEEYAEDEGSSSKSKEEGYRAADPFTDGQSGRGIHGPVPGSGPDGIGIDPYHPTVRNSEFHAPHNPLQHYHQPPQHHHAGHGHHPGKKHVHQHETALLPMDKTLVYVGMILSWIFWIVTFTTYYHVWGPGHSINIEKGNLVRRNNPEDGTKGPVVGLSQGAGPGPFLAHAGRSLDTGTPSNWNVSWGQVLYMISLAQETYEKFDFQSLDCQKKALCELSQKEDNFGETGRKISNSFSVMDAIDGLPMPTIIQTYLKEYREAINMGRSSTKECSAVYGSCGFSIKEVFAKYQKRAAAGKF